jgi:hypothetical protein
MGQRRLLWTTVRKAAKLVDEPGLALLFLRFLEIEKFARSPQSSTDDEAAGTTPTPSTTA